MKDSIEWNSILFIILSWWLNGRCKVKWTELKSDKKDANVLLSCGSRTVFLFPLLPCIMWKRCQPRKFYLYIYNLYLKPNNDIVSQTYMLMICWIELHIPLLCEKGRKVTMKFLFEYIQWFMVSIWTLIWFYS